MPTNWLASLDKDTTLLTANRRLAAYWLDQYDHFQRQSGNKVWHTLDILPLKSWLMRCWQTLSDTRLLLNTEQALIIWEQVINESAYSNLLLQPSAMAVTAKQAWELIQQYQLPLAEIKAEPPTEDTLALLDWIQRYQTLCETQNWCDEASLPALITHAVSKNALALPKRFILLGFEQIDPQSELLIQQLQLHAKVDFYNQQSSKVNKSKIGLPDSEQEIITMAKWAKQCLHAKPATTVGCIVPNLSEVRAQVQRIFTEVLTPWKIFATKDHHALFNISLGLPLNEYPLINTALLCLRLIWDKPQTSELGYLLQSPFLHGAETEFMDRAYLDYQLRQVAEEQVGYRQLLALARKYTPLLAQVLSKWQELIKQIPGQQSPSDWSKTFSNLLNKIGFTKGRSLNSEEYQLLQRWELLLKELANLDPVLPLISAKQAWQTLQQLSQTAIFQPKTITAPIQILGVLEANGMVFDNVWVMGLSDDAWPPATSSNPLIPIKLQRRWRMPHASSEIKFDYYQKITTTLLSSARNIICSYPLQQGEQHCRPSTLLKDVKEVTLTALNLAAYTPYSQHLLGKGVLEKLHDEQAPPILPDEIISGGTQIFKLQASCPFRAFATYRLLGEELSSREAGLDAAERGTLLHDVMARIWQVFGTQEHLLSRSSEEIENTLTTAVTQAITHYIPKRPLTLKKRFTEIEIQRLKSIVNNWLKLEKNRKKFKVIHKEYSLTSTIGGLSINMRVDRVDELEDGSQLIIDYKTGETSINDWFSDRPNEPQLPLYCIASEDPIQGLVFAQISAKTLRFNGIALSSSIPKIKTLEQSEWDEQVSTWRSILTELSDAFCRGDAAVAPKQAAQTCRYCEFKILCRVHDDQIPPGV